MTGGRRTPKEEDKVFGRFCLQKGYLRPDDLETALEDQRVMEKRGIRQSLSDILVAKKALTPEQRQEILRQVRIQTGDASRVASFDVISKLGQGGMGVVYKARHHETGGLVALKVLPPHLARDREYLERFKRETEILQTLSHRNIVGCVDAGFDSERKIYYCATELIEGESVSRRIRREGLIPQSEAVDITLQVTQAIQHAHYHGLVHRDIKPGNIMLTPDGTAKLLDLGLARDIARDEAHVTHSGMYVGSPHYSSPEQARGLGVDIRSDIYSLGATLYHMVTGETPFHGTNSADILVKHMNEDLAWPSHINSEISENTCSLIEKMLAKEPSDRYANPKQLLSDLHAIKEGRAPIHVLEAGKSTISRRSNRAIRRRLEESSTQLVAVSLTRTKKGRKLLFSAAAVAAAIAAVLALFLLGPEGMDDGASGSGTFRFTAKPALPMPLGALTLLDFDASRGKISAVSSPHKAAVKKLKGIRLLVVLKKERDTKPTSTVRISFPKPLDLSAYRKISFAATAGPGATSVRLGLETSNGLAIPANEEGTTKLSIGPGWQRYDLVLDDALHDVRGLLIAFNTGGRYDAFIFSIDDLCAHGGVVARAATPGRAVASARGTSIDAPAPPVEVPEYTAPEGTVMFLGFEPWEDWKQWMRLTPEVMTSGIPGMAAGPNVIEPADSNWRVCVQQQDRQAALLRMTGETVIVFALKAAQHPVKIWMELTSSRDDPPFFIRFNWPVPVGTEWKWNGLRLKEGHLLSTSEVAELPFLFGISRIDFRSREGAFFVDSICVYPHGEPDQCVARTRNWASNPSAPPVEAAEPAPVSSAPSAAATQENPPGRVILRLDAENIPDKLRTGAQDFRRERPGSPLSPGSSFGSVPFPRNQDVIFRMSGYDTWFRAGPGTLIGMVARMKSHPHRLAVQAEATDGEREIFYTSESFEVGTNWTPMVVSFAKTGVYGDGAPAGRGVPLGTGIKGIRIVSFGEPAPAFHVDEVMVLENAGKTELLNWYRARLKGGPSAIEGPGGKGRILLRADFESGRDDFNHKEVERRITHKGSRGACRGKVNLKNPYFSVQCYTDKYLRGMNRSEGFLRLGEHTRLRFACYLKDTDFVHVQYWNQTRDGNFYVTTRNLEEGVWNIVEIDLNKGVPNAGDGSVCRAGDWIKTLSFYAGKPGRKATLIIDDVVIFEPSDQ